MAGVVRFGAGWILAFGVLVAANKPELAAQSATADKYATDSIPLVSITTGDRFTCGLTAEGRAYCWGANQYGQLGGPAGAEQCEVEFNIHGACSLRPVAVSGDVRFAAIDAGEDHVCGLTAAGEAWCWGRNLSGQLGTADSIEHCSVADFEKYPTYKGEACSRRPVRVASDKPFSRIWGGRWTTCALTAEGVTYCWGNGSLGPFDESRGGVPTPLVVPGLDPLVSLDVGGTTCGITTSGRIVCFDCCFENAKAPAFVESEVLFASIVGGSDHFCALSRDREAYCWGDNSSGELGSGVVKERRPTTTPGKVDTPLRFRSLAAGFSSTCGITDDGSLLCWGTGSVLGDAAADRCHHTDSWDSCAKRPTLMMDGSRTQAVAVSGLHACAIDGAHLTYCWGNNDSGAIGNGTTVFWSHPVRVMGAPTSNTRIFIANDLIYVIVALLPLVAGLGFVFTGRRRERVRVWRFRHLSVCWGLSIVAVVVAGFLASVVPRGYAPFAIAILAVELIVVTICVTMYWAVARLMSRAAVTRS